jgi:hypothetical protein
MPALTHISPLPSCLTPGLFQPPSRLAQKSPMVSSKPNKAGAGFPPKSGMRFARPSSPGLPSYQLFWHTLPARSSAKNASRVCDDATDVTRPTDQQAGWPPLILVHASAAHIRLKMCFGSRNIAEHRAAVSCVGRGVGVGSAMVSVATEMGAAMKPSIADPPLAEPTKWGAGLSMSCWGRMTAPPAPATMPALPWFGGVAGKAYKKTTSATAKSATPLAAAGQRRRHLGASATVSAASS